jgi:uncharacterized DUF497 family protein
MVEAGARISWEIPHAKRRAAERDVPIFVAERIVRAGVVTDLSVEADGHERWRVSGRDPDGRPVDVVVTPVGGDVLRVITVIRTDE